MGESIRYDPSLLQWSWGGVLLVDVVARMCGVLCDMLKVKRPIEHRDP